MDPPFFYCSTSHHLRLFPCLYHIKSLNLKGGGGINKMLHLPLLLYISILRPLICPGYSSVNISFRKLMICVGKLSGQKLWAYWDLGKKLTCHQTRPWAPGTVLDGRNDRWRSPPERWAGGPPGGPSAPRGALVQQYLCLFRVIFGAETIVFFSGRNLKSDLSVFREHIFQG